MTFLHIEAILVKHPKNRQNAQSWQAMNVPERQIYLGVTRVHLCDTCQHLCETSPIIPSRLAHLPLCMVIRVIFFTVNACDKKFV